MGLSICRHWGMSALGDSQRVRSFIFDCAPCQRTGHRGCQRTQHQHAQDQPHGPRAVDGVVAEMALGAHIQIMKGNYEMLSVCVHHGPLQRHAL